MLRYALFATLVTVAIGCHSGPDDPLSSSSPREAPSGDSRKPVPARGFDTQTLRSSDGRILVTVDKPTLGAAHHSTAASQVSIRDTHHAREHVFSWGDDGPYSVSLPIITDMIIIGQGRYLLLGWAANSVLEVRLTAWIVNATPDKLTIAKTATLEGDGVKFVVFRRRLGLFRQTEATIINASIMGQDRTRDVAHSTTRAPSHAGHWYTRPALSDFDSANGNVFWVDLKPHDHNTH